MTANTKNVFKQLEANPYATFYTMHQGEEFRISGKVTFVDDPSLKKTYFTKTSPLVQDQYKSPMNPVIEYFYIADGKLSYSVNGTLQETLQF